MTNIEQERALRLPELPDPEIYKGVSDFGKGEYATGYTEDQMREYGRQCAEQAHAQQPSAAVGAEPVAWLIYWGLLDKRPRHPAHPTREAAEAFAAVIKSDTEVRPLYLHPAADVLADAERYRAARRNLNLLREAWQFLGEDPTEDQMDAAIDLLISARAKGGADYG